MDSTTSAPSPWSPTNPNLQIAIDSSSLVDVEFCPRYYQYTHLDGWAGSSIDLVFGGHAAQAFETFQKGRVTGMTKDEALFAAVKEAMHNTYDQDTDRQFGGFYADHWHCRGDVPYKNAKGNRAKCPYSHAHAFFPAPAPSICGECGGSIEEVRRYVPDSPAKNRQTLIRLIVWYAEEKPEDFHDSLHPYVFPDGTPAVELSGRLPLPFTSPYGDTYLLTWHFDYIGTYADMNYIVDNKTTTKTLNAKFWNSYAPNLQFDTYDLIGSIVLPDLDIQGIMIDAAQTLAGSASFGMHPYYKTESQRAEQLLEIERILHDMERYAAEGYWPMRKRSCWLCPFKKVCALPPEDRQKALAENFTKRERWNPLVER